MKRECFKEHLGIFIAAPLLIGVTIFSWIMMHSSANDFVCSGAVTFVSLFGLSIFIAILISDKEKSIKSNTPK